ncbi:MAG: branched-chain amino acid ABC transporter permease [Candidatus Bathyarchaeia archaeon]|jgi:branched-chain amino acid transport system permease protein
MAIKKAFANSFSLVKSEVADFYRSQKLYPVIITLIIAAIMPFFVSSYVISEVLTPMIIFAIYASSWNLLASSGQGSLGHAAFLGIGGFTSALLTIKLGLPSIASLFLGSLISAAIGVLIGLACVRLKAWFLAMVTFGFSVIIVTIFSEFDEFTGAIMGFRTPLIVERGIPFYYTALVFSAISIFIIYLIMKSKLGLAFRAIHQNELEAKMIGINTAKYRLIAFVISTFFAGLAGELYAQSIQYIQNFIFAPYYSFLPLMMSVIGGLGTIEGPIVGSVIIRVIDSYLPSVDSALDGLLHPLFPSVSHVGPPLRMLGLGVFFIVIVIFAPKGVSPLIKKAYNYLRSSPKEKKTR